ncbi:MAG: HPP family protein [Candidatus Hydrogenedentota bacterium]
MRFFDPKFKDNPGKYIAQCTMAALVLFVVLLLLEATSNAAVIGALGASSFIAFTMPHANVSKPRYILGGYAVGIVVGVACYYISQLAVLENVPLFQESGPELFGALAVGISIFGMVITNLEHPPAAGVALGLALNVSMPRTLIVIIVGIVGLTLGKMLLKPLLIDLL